MPQAPIITAGIPEKDRCPVLTRIKAFIGTQGVCSQLEYVFRDRQGNPINLLTALGLQEPVSISTGVSVSDSIPSSQGVVRLRVKEYLGTGRSPIRNPLWEMTGEFVDPERGVVRAPLNAAIVEHPGIYSLGWGVADENGQLLAVNDGLLSIERSLFAAKIKTVLANLGPPTLNEIRMTIADSSPAENLLLDDLEFGDEQIMLAVALPIQFFNDRPPPLGFEYTTRNFPFRSEWFSAIQAQLYKIAAAGYRRNRLPYTAGGVTISDQDKEKEYLGAYQMLWEDWKNFVMNKKVSMNAQQMFGQVLSPYSSHYP